jgi:hypothetical protein
MMFMIKGVSHRRSNQEGTITEILLARQDASPGSLEHPVAIADAPSEPNESIGVLFAIKKP